MRHFALLILTRRLFSEALKVAAKVRLIVKAAVESNLGQADVEVLTEGEAGFFDALPEIQAAWFSAAEFNLDPLDSA